tara:strand:- start:72 stop:344 length:273 start_codon:yes stop_codon:yes gene_type:complete
MFFSLKKSFQISKCKFFGFGILLLILIFPQFSLGHDKERPTFNQSRYKEDFQFLKNSENRTDVFDPLKYFPFNKSKSIYLTLGGGNTPAF